MNHSTGDDHLLPGQVPTVTAKAAMVTLRSSTMIRSILTAGEVQASTAVLELPAAGRTIEPILRLVIGTFVHEFRAIREAHPIAALEQLATVSHRTEAIDHLLVQGRGRQLLSKGRIREGKGRAAHGALMLPRLIEIPGRVLAHFLGALRADHVSAGQLRAHLRTESAEAARAVLDAQIRVEDLLSE